MKNYHLALLIISALLINNIIADGMEEVVVTSSLLESSEINNPLYVIDGEDITDGASTSLGEAIDSYLGVSIADYGSAVGQPIIRGMSGPRVRILKNGMVNRDVSSLGVDHLNDLDLNNVQQIEIVKGPSSLLYANGSIGGIINVVDDCIAEMDFAGSEFSAGYEKQSVNDGTAQNFNFKDNVGGFNVNFGYSKIELGNFDVPDGAILHEEEEHEGEEEEHEDDNLGFVNNSDYQTEATKFGISKAGDWGYLGFSIDGLESVYGIPFHGEEHEEEEGGEEHEEERIFSTTDSDSFTVKGSLNMSGDLVNSVDFTFRDSDYILTEAHAEEEHDEEEHEEEEHEEHEPTSFMSASTEYGAIFDLSNDNITQKIVFNVLDEDSSIIGEEAFMNPATSEEFTLGYFISKDIGMYNVDFGLRMDQIDRSGSVTDEDHGDMDYYNIDDTTNSFAVTLGKSLGDSLDVDFGFASVERLPSVIELFMNGPHLATGRLEVGNPNLKSETSNNFDVTFDYDNGDFYGYASFYINKVDNYITLMDEDDEHGDEDHDEDHGDDDHGDDHGDDHDDHADLIHSFYVQENAEFIGYELEFGRTVNLASGDLTYSFGRDQVNAEFADGHNVPRINPARNVYTLSYKQNDTVFKINLKSVERQNDFAEGETATDSYRMLDTRVTKTFSVNDKSRMKVTLFANNLLDDVARNHSSFVKGPVPLPGRNVGIKFNLTF
jgi:iron complex outermembrane receptor protein|tara:strand:- start:830 stop:2986 length:2157 start_codon:yes stop_codon:yes gene_type:complete